MKILISIVSHNQQILISRLLRSIDQFVQTKAHEVLIVVTENTRKENTGKSRCFELKKIDNLREKGFGANHNAAFERFDSDVFLIVNPDIVLSRNFDLDLLVKFLFEHKVDLASPTIFDASGALEDYKRSDLNFWNLFKRKVIKIPDSKFDWLAGMFLIVRSESFRSLRGFDTEFFMYVEDCDLSMRARAAGMTLVDFKNFSVIHDARRASQKNFKHLKWHVTSLLKYWFLK